MDRKKNILCVNGGSSSIKFSVFGVGEVYGAGGEDWSVVLKGKIDRIGLAGAYAKKRAVGGVRAGGIKRFDRT